MGASCPALEADLPCDCGFGEREGMMAEKPILFKGEMVRAILSGTKTQTRRVVKPHPRGNFERAKRGFVVDGSGTRSVAFDTYYASKDIPCPYGKPGDRLWVRESYCPRYFDDYTHGYRADWSDEAAEFLPEPKWKPSIHMFRKDSRIDLLIKDIRVERLQDISDEDVLHEGFRMDNTSIFRLGYQGAFEMLWNSINAKKHPWESNPWVWVVEFEIETP